jgi:methionyl-tRNA formyltransferase
MSAQTDVASLRTVFFGTPELAVPALEALAVHTTILACVTQPDKPVGRKQILTSPAIKIRALELGIAVSQPASLRRNKPGGEAFYQQFREWAPELVLVFAYGKIIPTDYLSLPRLGCLNIHPSLLPEFRGPTPIQSAIRSCQSMTGVSVMKLDAGMDTGPLLGQTTEPIRADDTAATLGQRLGERGATLFTELLPAYASGTLVPTPQAESGASVTALLNKADGQIDWSRPPAELDCFIRAMNPWPVAFTERNGLRIKVTRAHLNETGALAVDEVVPEGKPPMPYAEFLRRFPGYSLPPAA